MVEHDVADYAVLHIVGEEARDNGSVGGEIGGATHQACPKEHAGFVVGEGIRAVGTRFHRRRPRRGRMVLIRLAGNTSPTGTLSTW